MAPPSDVDAGGGRDIAARGAGARARERAKAAALLAADPKVKKYTAQVERCLQAFDGVQEWADFIAFLGKLLKTMQAHTQIPAVPHRRVVAKRLAQCLNPALPTGVHARALDVYAHVLLVLGPDGLKRDLPLWSAGLFPFFEYAATSVKPALLGIYETHFLPLQSALRPAAKALVLTLLPGLEEETGEFFDKVLALLDRLSGTLSPAFFLQTLWIVLLTAPAARAPALHYLSRRLPRLGPRDTDVAPIVGRDTGLMLRAFAAALEHDDLLVRRAALDVLVQTLPLDSAALARAQEDDRRILMRAAASVVLRRDLSLNRRLYAWLLGPGADEAQAQVQTPGPTQTQAPTPTPTSTQAQGSTSTPTQAQTPGPTSTPTQAQGPTPTPTPTHAQTPTQGQAQTDKSAFFRAHGLALLRGTLLADMGAGAPRTARPFKVFVSLLDRWDVGAPLVEALLFDAMRAVWAGAVAEGNGEGGDLVMAANTLYDAVEPLAVWTQLFRAVRGELLRADCSGAPPFQALGMLRFVLTALRMQDDEVREVHLPLVFAAVLELLRMRMAEDAARTRPPALREALLLLAEAVRHVPTAALARPVVPAQHAAARGPYARACRFYGVPEPEEEGRTRSDVPLVTAAEDLVVLSAACADGAADAGARGAFVAALALLGGLVERIGGAEEAGAEVVVDWEPAVWLAGVLRALERSASFEVADRVVSTVVALAGAARLHPPLIIDERKTMSRMLDSLFAFLRVDCAPYHVRTVHLIWLLEHATTHHHVESVVAQSLAARGVHDAYEAFGVLWRLTDDALLPGFRFKVPMLIVLDTLQSHDPALRRVGETWMRCSLKSYTRVLEPLLHELLDPAIRRVPSASTHSGREISAFTYERPFDQRRMDHILETLLALVKFGGQGFGRIARGAHYKKSNHRGLIERVEAAKLYLPEGTYMEILMEVLVRYLMSEPKDDLAPFMGHANAQIQANAIDLIQTIVARGELDGARLEIIEVAVVGKLFWSVHVDRVDLQNKLLHVLHSIISAASAAADSQFRAGSGGGGSKHWDPNGPDDSAHAEDAGRPPSAVVQVSPLLAQTLIDGITTAAGRPTLQHWLDFVLMTVPQYSRSLSHMVPPLSDCVCRQLRLALADVRKVLDSDSARSGSIVSSTTTDSVFIMLLNALERLVLLSLVKSHDSSASEEEPAAPERPIQDSSSGGLLGIVSNVFSSDSAGTLAEDHLSARSPGYHALHDAVRTLYSLWDLTANASNVPNVPEAESLSLIFSRARTRGRKVLERFFRGRASEVMESIIECWFRDTTAAHGDRSTAFEIVDVLTSSAQTVVHMLCESILYRATTSDKIKKPTLNPNLSDTVIFSFLEEYLSRLEGPLVVQVWARCIALAKEFLGNVHGYKQQLFPALRCITVLADKISQTTVIDDRKTRKELQETFVKLVDNSILIAGRSFDQGTWIRRSTKENPSANGGPSLVPRTTSDEGSDEKTAPSSLEGSVMGIDPAEQINAFISSRVLPNLRKILLDNDKVVGICTNLVYYVIAPAMKVKTSRTLDVDESILETLQELSKLPPSAKAWRNPVSEAFNDNRFFNSAPQTSRKWLPIIRALIDTDRQAFPELLGKISSTGSTNIFANREYETLVRSLNLRRLSYVIFSGEKNHFLTQLPSIQEKLVDILRNQNSSLMQSEVYLCLRVLLCRLSPHNLSSFWPVILTELLRIFDQITTEPPTDGSDDLHVILSASKFIDFMLTLQTEEFQIHQWMFVTDTVDAVYRPDAWFPEALLDQLAEIISDLPTSNLRETKPDSVNAKPFIEYGRLDSAVSYNEHPSPAMRRPLLSSVRQIDSIRELVPFFSHVSIASYESVYHCSGNVDWDAVEESLLEDMFDGR